MIAFFRKWFFLFFIFCCCLNVSALTITVTNNSGGTNVGSLRWALNVAEANPGADKIVFDGDYTIQPVGNARILFFDDSGLIIDAGDHEIIIDGSLMTGDPTWPLVGIWLYDSRYSGGWGKLAKNVIIKGLIVQNCAYGGGLVSGGASDITFEDCKFINNGSNGLKIDGKDPSSDGAQEVENINVINCEAYGNDENGIVITNVKEVNVENTYCYSNTNAGIWLISNVSDVDISNCYVGLNSSMEKAGNNWPGIIVSGDVSNSNITRCTVAHNQGEGIKIDDSCSDIRIAKSTVYSNLYSGILITGGSSSNEVLDSVIHRNEQAGVWISNSSFHNKVYRNRIGVMKNGTVDGNGWSGVIVSEGAEGNIIGGHREELGNIIAGHPVEGIKVDGRETNKNLLRFNVFYENGWGGIRLYNGANEGLAVPYIYPPTQYDTPQDVVIYGIAPKNSLVDIYISDSNTDKTQARYYLGTVNADSSGNFSFPFYYNYQGNLITAIAHDSRGNSSGFDMSLTDIGITGKVIDSKTGDPVYDAQVFLYDANGNLFTGAKSGTDGSFSFCVTSGSYFIKVDKEGWTFPSQKNADLAAFQKGEAFKISSSMDITIPLDAGFPIEVDLQMSSKSIKPGDPLRIKVTVSNHSNSDLNNIKLKTYLPSSLKLLNDSSIRQIESSTAGQNVLNSSLSSFQSVSSGQTQSFDATTDSVVVPLTSINANEKQVFNYICKLSGGNSADELTVGARVYQVFGDTFFYLSSLKTQRIEVEDEMVMDNSTLIGKVFYDQNQNGMQDENEQGLSNVTIVSSKGMIITTDQFGRYSVPTLKSGTHVFAVKHNSLPQGYYFENQSQFVRIREGSLHKLNFAIYSEDRNAADLSAYSESDNSYVFQVKESLNSLDPLNVVTIEKNGESYLSQTDAGDYQLFFNVFSNCKAFIQEWELVIENVTDGGLIFSKKEKSSNLSNLIAVEINKNQLKKLNNNDISWYLKITYQNGNIEKTDKNVARISHKGFLHLPSIALKSSFDDFEKKEKIGCPLNKTGAISVSGDFDPDSKYIIFLSQNSQTIFNQVIYTEEKGKIDYEFLSPYGEFDVSIAKEQNGVNVEIDSKKVLVRENFFLFVGMGEAEIGKMSSSGKIEMAGKSDKFKEKLYSKGYGSFFLKGKIRGKYLISASFDSEREEDRQMFKYIDEDKFYPIYGDFSKTSWDATDSEGKFYFLIEWDRSMITLGNYEVDFDENSLIYFTRTLYGAKADIKSEKIDGLGNNDYRVMFFVASPDYIRSLNRIRATGGSLYYLKHSSILEGSEKVIIETRDQVTGSVIREEEKRRDIDYEINYDDGRIIFNYPVFSSSYSKRLTSDSISYSNPNYVVISYEYENDSLVHKNNGGLRLEKGIKDKFTVGATYINAENSNGDDTEISGVDIRTDISENSFLKVEAAKTKNNSSLTERSISGGLDFYDQGLDDHKSGEAYRAVFVTEKPGKLEAKVFIEERKPGFQNEKDMDQLNRTKVGADLNIKINNDLSLYSNIYHEKMDELYFESEGFEKKTDARVGITYDMLETLRLESEYHLIDYTNYDTLNKTDADLFGLGIFWDVRPDFSLFIKSQLSSGDQDLDALQAGFEYQVFKHLTLGLSQSYGDQGEYTKICTNLSLNENDEVYLNYEDYSISDNNLVLGINHLIDRNSMFFSELRYNNSQNRNYTSSVSGYKKKLSDYSKVTFSYEREYLDELDDESQVISGGYSFYQTNKWMFNTQLELRKVDGSSDYEQLLTKNKIKLFLDGGLSLFAKVYYSYSEDNITNDDLAGFTELTIGAAYRPIRFDFINFLVKYSNLKDDDPFYKNDDSLLINEKSEVVSGEFIVDLIKNVQYFFKYAQRKNYFDQIVNVTDKFSSKVDLWINRFNIYFSNKFGTAIEYRQKEFDYSEDSKSGFTSELFYDFDKNLRLTLGYNFTDFSDDLTSSNDYSYKGPYIRFTGKAYFEDLKFKPPFKEEFYKWKKVEWIPENITVNGRVDLAIGTDDGKFEWNKSNINKFEKNWRYLFGEEDKNTLNEGFYNSIQADVNIPLSDKWSVNTGFNINPHMVTAKSDTIHVTSDSGDSADFKFYYWSADDIIVPISVRTKNGNSFLTGERSVSDFKVDGYSIKTNWGDTFTIPEVELKKEIMPFKDISLNYADGGSSFFKLNILTDTDGSYASDDPLFVVGRKNFWQPHPWLNYWNPGDFYYGNMHAFERGAFDESITYYSRNNGVIPLTMLRGLQFGKLTENFGRFEGTVAAPVYIWEVYDQYFEPNNVSGALRWKSAFAVGANNIQTGATYSVRTGYDDEQLDFLNQVFAFDSSFTLLRTIKTTMEFAQSLTETDKTTVYEDEYQGEAFSLNFNYEKYIRSVKNIFDLKLTIMDEKFLAAGSDYRFTSLDQYWSKHLNFYEYNDRYEREVEPTRLGDGIRENRRVMKFYIISDNENSFMNKFSYIYIQNDSEGDFLESRFRDEFSLQLANNLDMKVMLLHYRYPSSDEDAEPLAEKSNVFDGLELNTAEKEIYNDSIVEGEDSSLSTASVGFKWKVCDWLSFEGMYEYTNNYGDQFPQFLLSDTTYGRVETVDGVRYDAPMDFLYDQDLFELPAYDFYNIYRVKAFVYPIDNITCQFSWTKNENKFAGGIDDNINHLFFELKYESTDNKLLARTNVTRSKTYDLPRYLENNELDYDSNTNFFAECRYKLSDNSDIYVHYGVFSGMQADNSTPFMVVPWSLPVLETRDIFKVAYTKKY